MPPAKYLEFIARIGVAFIQITVGSTSRGGPLARMYHDYMGYIRYFTLYPMCVLIPKLPLLTVVCVTYVQLHPAIVKLIIVKNLL